MFNTAEVMQLANASRPQVGEVTPQVCDAVVVVLREGAERLIRQVVEAEADGFVEDHRDLKDDRGRQRVVRNGYVVARKVQTCVGEHTIRVPRVRDLAGGLHFKSRVLSPYQRRIEGQKDWFTRAYLEGISCGDFHEAMLALLGSCGGCISQTAGARLKARWRAEHLRWINRDLSGTHWDHLPVNRAWREECGCWLGFAPRDRGVPIGVASIEHRDAAAQQEPSPDVIRHGGCSSCGTCMHVHGHCQSSCIKVLAWMSAVAMSDYPTLTSLPEEGAMPWFPIHARSSGL